MIDTGFKTHNARATTAHQTPPPHLSALMLLVDNYTIMGHARKYPQGQLLKEVNHSNQFFALKTRAAEDPLPG